MKRVSITDEQSRHSDGSVHKARHVGRSEVPSADKGQQAREATLSPESDKETGESPESRELAEKPSKQSGKAIIRPGRGKITPCLALIPKCLPKLKLNLLGCAPLGEHILAKSFGLLLHP